MPLSLEALMKIKKFDKSLDDKLSKACKRFPWRFGIGEKEKVAEFRNYMNSDLGSLTSNIQATGLTVRVSILSGGKPFTRC